MSKKNNNETSYLKYVEILTLLISNLQDDFFYMKFNEQKLFPFITKIHDLNKTTESIALLQYCVHGIMSKYTNYFSVFQNGLYGSQIYLLWLWGEPQVSLARWYGLDGDTLREHLFYALLGDGG